MVKPGLWKLAPAVVIKPWGLVHTSALDFTGITVGLGEFWLASAQTGPGNYSNSVADPALGKTLAELLGEARSEGDDALAELIGPRPLAHLRRNPYRGKAEAWHVRAAEGRTGVAAGPATADDAERLQLIIQMQGLAPDVESWSDEVRALLGLIEPLEGGEVFFAPAGTLHTMFAIGPESRLIIDEIQQGYGAALLPTLSKILMVQDNLLSVQVHPDDETVSAVAENRMSVDQDLPANPTVRVYDFGRRPGERPELGFQLVDPEAGLRRVTPVKVELPDGQSVEVVVAGTHFVKSRICMMSGGVYELACRFGSYRVLHCLCGAAELRAGNRAMALDQGETVLVPACLEEDLRIATAEHCALFDDAFPDIATLSAFLGRHGANANQIESLLAPPRAVRVVQ